MIRLYSLRTAWVLVALGLFPAAEVASAATPPGAAADSLPAPALITGVVVDAETGAPIAAAQVRLRELQRGDLTRADGRFRFAGVAAGTYTLSAQRIGYAPQTRTLTVAAGATGEVRLELRPTALEVAGVVVTGTGRERGAGEAYRPTSVLSEARLRRELGATVSATIAGEPGIHEQYNGPAANQPVIRGMGGDRVLVLEDGQRTGDLYGTGADHAVAVDPLTAERIEVVRGPAGLLYGSNALGGVINVIREEVPASLPERVTTTASLQAESVFRGVASGAAVLVPAGRVALRAELSGRQAGDTRTPLGVLGSTGMRGLNGSTAASLIASWGYAGASVRHHRLDHGVPGEFGGVAIPGAHPGGVEVESQRTTGRVRAAHLRGFGPFRALELDGGIVRYLHDEIEGRGPRGERWIGTSFDQLAGDARLLARHEHGLGDLRTEGAFGLTYAGTDLRGSGSAPGLRSAREQALAAFVYEELGWGRVSFQAGARYDRVAVTPYSTRPIVVGRGAEAREIPVAPRTFGGLSGSVATLWEAAPGLSLGVSLARAFRAPAIQELFSDGPHLADFSFDIGNPALEPEVGHGLDLFARVSLPRLELEASLFANALSNYIHHQATGEIDARFGRFPVFAARGDDALFRGAEGRVQWEPARRLVLEGTVSHVRATRTATDDPLPDIPPLTGLLGLRYERAAWFASAGWRGAAAQNRVPREILSPIREGEAIRPQGPTPGYALWNAGLGLRWSEGGRFHTVTLNLLNVFDEVWRDHLSRVKQIAPQPGRNLQLLYRVNL
jgi:iron complex outermembrane recepter protein